MNHGSLGYGDDCLCIDNLENEYRIGRPNIYKTDDGYEMFSVDGKKWVRHDELLNLNKSEFGFDSEMACYPAKFIYKNRTYLFYNGNGMGKAGVGWAELVEK